MPNGNYFAYYFKECNSLETVTVESISEIGYNAFNSVKAALKGDIVINEGVTKIYGEGVFSGCSSITSVSLPSTLTEIGASAFNNCIRLQTINVNMTEEEWSAVTKKSNWNRNVTANIVFK